LFTLPLARHFEHVIGVEATPAAADFARRNLAEANLQNAEIITSRVSHWLEYAASGQRAADFVLLDPPRAGVEDKGIEGLLALHPSRISYVSCDPATLARDLRKLLADGYLLDSLVAFDMFPQTHHVETVARLAYGDT
jgi:23S rRNA (uracil1939-C5)-methyltransferase